MPETYDDKSYSFPTLFGLATLHGKPDDPIEQANLLASKDVNAAPSTLGCRNSPSTKNRPCLLNALPPRRTTKTMVQATPAPPMMARIPATTSTATWSSRTRLWRRKPFAQSCQTGPNASARRSRNSSWSAPSTRSTASTLVGTRAPTWPAVRTATVGRQKMKKMMMEKALLPLAPQAAKPRRPSTPLLLSTGNRWNSDILDQKQKEKKKKTATMSRTRQF
mmetsp:Transcript_87012/g.168521  ORF Transcript_87012/g.168521 Transcript_87012/m.168521 type:complete len:221 (-) Transcript_87012:815-1477(-)